LTNSLVVKLIARKSNRLRQNYTKVHIGQIEPGVGVSSLYHLCNCIWCLRHNKTIGRGIYRRN